MKFSNFKKCLKVLEYYLNEETSIFQKIEQHKDIVETYVIPFKDEINKNILTLNTSEAKGTLVKHYLFEFIELNGFFRDYSEILYSGCIFRSY